MAILIWLLASSLVIIAGFAIALYKVNCLLRKMEKDFFSALDIEKAKEK